MAVPKRKVSKSKRNSRRAHHARKFSTANLSVCPQCREPKLPHRVCIQCGYYRDREVVKMEKF